MRKGSNPYKDQKTNGNATHRIIVPVFIPNLEDDYFTQGLEFTRLCLESLLKTKHSRSILTVVNNGSCAEVTEYLQELYRKGAIDQLVHHGSNLGKIDAVIPIARSCEEPLVTITDGDVLFLNGWMAAVEEVFSIFPEAGMVSPVPHGTTYSNYTVNTLFDGYMKNSLSFQSCCDPQDMLRFAESIGKSDSMYSKKSRLKYQLTVKRKDFSAVVGCGHFVATYRKEVFNHSPKEWSHWAYATQADRQYLDIPNEKAGLWRLATVGNFAYHMGNQPTDWMKDRFDVLTQNTDPGIEIQISKKLSWIPFSVKKFFVRLLLSKYFRASWFKTLGLKEHRDEY